MFLQKATFKTQLKPIWFMNNNEIHLHKNLIKNGVGYPFFKQAIRLRLFEKHKKSIPVEIWARNLLHKTI